MIWANCQVYGKDFDPKTMELSAQIIWKMF